MADAHARGSDCAGQGFPETTGLKRERRSAMTAALPQQMHVFVRDWLSSNNIVLRSDTGNVLIDSGHCVHAPLTLALLKSGQGLGDAPLARLINTHCHSDHMG